MFFSGVGRQQEKGQAMLRSEQEPVFQFQILINYLWHRPRGAGNTIQTGRDKIVFNEAPYKLIRRESVHEISDRRHIRWPSKYRDENSFSTHFRSFNEDIFGLRYNYQT
jgi:hypothetical protein